MSFLYLFFLGGWLVINFSKYKLNTSTLLLLIYFISALLSIFLISIDPKTYLFTTFTSVLSHILLLFLFIYPIVYFGNHINLNRIVISDVQVRRLSILCIIAGGSAIIISIFELEKLLVYDSFEVMRSAQLNQGDMSLYKYGVVGYLATIGSVTPIFSLFLSFYRWLIQKKTDIIFYLLIISSFSGVAINLTIAGRDGIVRWFLFFIFSIVLYKDYLKKSKIPRLALAMMVVVLISLLVVFLSISVDRFGEKDNLYLSLFDYIGQPFCFYSSIYNNVGNKTLFGFSSLFPFLGEGAGPLDIARSSFSFRTDVFPTFLGTFVLCVGYIKTLLMGFVFFLFSFILNKKKAEKLSNIVSYMIFYQIVYIGIFYFVYAMLAWQLSFVIIYLLSRKIYTINNVKI